MQRTNIWINSTNPPSSKRGFEQDLLRTLKSSQSFKLCSRSPFNKYEFQALCEIIILKPSLDGYYVDARHVSDRRMRLHSLGLHFSHFLTLISSFWSPSSFLYWYFGDLWNIHWVRHPPSCILNLAPNPLAHHHHHHHPPPHHPHHHHRHHHCQSLCPKKAFAIGPRLQLASSPSLHPIIVRSPISHFLNQDSWSPKIWFGAIFGLFFKPVRGAIIGKEKFTFEVLGKLGPAPIWRHIGPHTFWGPICRFLANWAPANQEPGSRPRQIGHRQIEPLENLGAANWAPVFHTFVLDVFGKQFCFWQWTVR